MEEKLKNLELLTEVLKSINILCLGIVVQLLINDTLLVDPNGKKNFFYWCYINCIIVYIIYKEEVIF